MERILARTKHLSFVDRDGWSFVRRNAATGVVCVVARTLDQRILLVEQHRPTFDQPVIELPAGLCGDQADQADESPEIAAERELLEETGYRGPRMQRLVETVSSAGLTDERVVFFAADAVQRVADGGGVGNEKITLHAVPVADIEDWLQQAAGAGKWIDARVYAGLHFLRALDRNG
jgi:ADP-ribose pyrophosphatase